MTEENRVLDHLFNIYGAPAGENPEENNLSENKPIAAGYKTRGFFSRYRVVSSFCVKQKKAGPKSCSKLCLDSSEMTHKITASRTAVLSSVLTWPPLQPRSIIPLTSLYIASMIHITLCSPHIMYLLSQKKFVIPCGKLYLDLGSIGSRGKTFKDGHG